MVWGFSVLAMCSVCADKVKRTRIKRISKARRKARRDRDKPWRECIKRDEGICVSCGAAACAVHEIVLEGNWAANKAECYVPWNMVCLCAKCHDRVHAKTKDSDNTFMEARRLMLKLLEKHDYDAEYEKEPWAQYMRCEEWTKP